MKNLLTIFLLIIVQFSFGQSGSIRGFVTDSNNELLKEAFILIEKEGEIIDRTKTNIYGEYKFDSLETGIYDFFIGKQFCREKEIFGIVLFEGETIVINFDLEKIDLDSSYLPSKKREIENKIIYRFQPKKSIYSSGKLVGKVDSESKKMGNFIVRIKQNNQVLHQTKTDSLGRFMIEGISLGKYDIEVQKDRYETVSWKGFKIEYNTILGFYEIHFEIQKSTITYFDSYFSLTHLSWFLENKIHLNFTQNTTFSANEIERSPIKN